MLACSDELPGTSAVSTVHMWGQMQRTSRVPGWVRAVATPDHSPMYLWLTAGDGSVDAGQRGWRTLYAGHGHRRRHPARAIDQRLRFPALRGAGSSRSSPELPELTGDRRQHRRWIISQFLPHSLPACARGSEQTPPATNELALPRSSNWVTNLCSRPLDTICGRSLRLHATGGRRRTRRSRYPHGAPGFGHPRESR